MAKSDTQIAHLIADKLLRKLIQLPYGKNIRPATIHDRQAASDILVAGLLEAVDTLTSVTVLPVKVIEKVTNLEPSSN